VGQEEAKRWEMLFSWSELSFCWKSKETVTQIYMILRYYILHLIYPSKRDTP